MNYTEEHIRSLDWREHIRLRPGMYIGKLGSGKDADDGIYILVKEILDNAIDEYIMGFGKEVHLRVSAQEVNVRDFGRGIPLGKVVDCVSKINTGGKYDSAVFQKSVGLNGVGTKAVNALSRTFRVCSFRDGKRKSATFSQGKITEDKALQNTGEPNGTEVSFLPDESIFPHYCFQNEHLIEMVRNYTFLNRGLKIIFNGETYVSQNGLLDLLNHKLEGESLCYPIIHLTGKDLEVAFTHGNQFGEAYYSFVNGAHTTLGGSHLTAFREGIVKTLKDHYQKDFQAVDVRSGLIGSVSIRVVEPVFESQTKTKLGSSHMAPDGETIRAYVLDFLKQELDNYLHRNPETRDVLLKKILQSERERKEIAGIKKLANERAKKANIFNKKLRDCRIHLNSKNPLAEASTLFITEGDSASGSLTKSRDVSSQAVFSIRGKPLNCYGLSKKIVYENEEFNLLQHALSIEDSLDDLRYNKIVMATDADEDGMHIRLLLLTFFLQFFPELVQRGHIYVLQTPLFRVRNKSKTFYCYSEEEKQEAIKNLGGKPEITRFKGLGEISPDEFGQFIGKDIKLEPVTLAKGGWGEMLKFYMGKNTQDRQDFVIGNLR
ncbi:MAG: ATP-binding protein [Deltaproteobacteria bacterium]|nr:ATP-binding protein [Deltaproteobacteria bacterium]